MSPRRPRGVYLDRTVRQRQVKPRGGVQRAPEQQPVAQAIGSADARRGHCVGRLGRAADAHCGLAGSARRGPRERPPQVLGEAIEASGLLADSVPARWGDKQVLGALRRVAARHPRAAGGLVVFVDEMGSSWSRPPTTAPTSISSSNSPGSPRAETGADCRRHPRQAFEEYAHRLSQEARDEWSKIEGWFVDLAVDTRDDEQIDLLGRAIGSDRPPAKPSRVAQGVAAMARAYTSPASTPDAGGVLAAPSDRRPPPRLRLTAAVRPEPTLPSLRAFKTSAVKQTMATSTRLTCCGTTYRPISNLPSWLLPTATAGPWWWTSWSGAGPWAAMRCSFACSRPSRWWGCSGSALV